MWQPCIFLYIACLRLFLVFQMFEYCLSPDTSGDGTGCDNMTCMVIHFSQDGLNAASASAKRPAEPEMPESTDSTDLPDAKKARTESQPS